ncbi:anaerobic sulfite reductase subunit AsrB [Lactonifactor longoviformis]|uniref:Anaerobic sulfite reductase subunit B n=1 Tax=Lactonifactor longoviformis DSM 17459 TaxID=1122155 RepID=A0A1M4XKQ1_9CLOT|nr:anaerobic sulfite reductase subunit AsrB [Lactonifactor longoviformis]POP33920.1 anaerobic sulfite reductase subunit AsrB [Lactonifactor longoviformis]SHE94030.1 anaerobic sulfite reductase subunit B [Lactonifactor longoviformis DSM 17459]
MSNEYIPFLSQIKEVQKHTEIEYSFRMSYVGDVQPGQFFEVSIPKFGEAPISVSGIGEGDVELTIRKVGKVTNEIFENRVGQSLFMRGPYGNGFSLDLYRGKELIIVAGGTGVSPVKGVIDYFGEHREEVKSLSVIAGFKSPGDILFKDSIKRWEKQMNLTVTVDHADDPGWKTGLVTAYIPEIPIENLKDAAAIVVGPPVMMKFSVAELLKRGIKEEQIWISQERKMCCGLGKCGHCKMDDTYICLDGPVFNYTKGKKLFD